jgi:hypothetical protein
MINATNLSRHYDTLEPRERLPLIIAASLRGDEVEKERLVRTAPKRTWAVPDFHGFAEGLREQVVEYLLQQLSGASLVWEALCYLAQKGESTEESSPELVPDWLRFYAYGIVARAEGWKVFCAEVPLDSAALLQQLPGYAAVCRIEKAAERLAFTHDEAEAYLLDNLEADDGDPPKERRVVLDGPADIAAAIREALEERQQVWG